MKQRFSTTRWTLIVKAGSEDDDVAQQALASLCESYWYPLYAFVRRKGHSPEDAEDVIQGYFAGFLEKGLVKKFRPEIGRFRTFILATLKHYLLHERDKKRALKRGGNVYTLSLDADDAENRYSLEPVDKNLTPDKVFERRWALNVLDRALGKLEQASIKSGKGEQFAELSPYLVSGADDVPYSEVAEKLEMSDGAVRVAVHRLRKRFGQYLRDEVAVTGADEADVQDELHHLIQVLSD